MGHLALLVRLTWVLILASFKPVTAEEISQDKSSSAVVELREVVITGTRTEKLLLEAPVRTEVVSREEIAKTHARDLKEALEDVPGLLLKPILGKSGFEVWLQGFNADRVLVVLDGEPITPSTGSTVDLSQIGTADIERIEIVKGATSALYGSNAMGGVINVITRKPVRPLAFSLTLDGGSYGGKNLSANANELAARRLAASLAIKRSSGYLQFNADLRDKKGYTLDPNTFRTEGESGSKSNLDLRLAWTPDDNTEIYITPRYYREDISNNISSFAPGVGEIKLKKNENARRLHTTLGMTREFNNGGRLRGWVLQDNWRDVTQQDAIATPAVEQERTAEIDLYRTELQWDLPWGKQHVFTSGLLLGQASLEQYQDRAGETRAIEVAGAQQRNIEAYLQDDIFIGEQWELVPGVRVQNDSDFGFYAAPKINAMFSPHWFDNWFDNVTTNMRLGVGRGYRVPNLKERFFVFDHSQLGYMLIGSDTLQPERSDSYQLGIEFARPGDFRVDLTVFHNRIKNLIDTRINPDKSAQTGLNIFDYQNFARALTQGVELSGNLYLDRFALKGGYTLLDSKDRDTRKSLKQRPRHQIKLGLDWEHKAWGTLLALRGVYQSKEFFDADNQLQSPAWNTWDLKLTQAVGPRAKWGFKVFGGIDNLTDEHRDPNVVSDNRPRAGRLVYLGVRVDG